MEAVHDFIGRPPQHKYCFMWNMEAVHDFIGRPPQHKYCFMWNMEAVHDFIGRPSQHKYCLMWNMEAVQDFIKKEYENNQELSDGFLTCSLTMLMSIISASHALCLQCLKGS